MKKTLVVTVALILLLNATAAIYGGGNFIIHPDGSSMDMSLDWLQNTPFHNYLIPGILLFIANGICSLVVLMALALKFKLYPWFIMAQGTVLFGWISIQMMMIQTINLHHFIFGSFGIALIIIGWLLRIYYNDHQTGNIEKL